MDYSHLERVQLSSICHSFDHYPRRGSFPLLLLIIETNQESVSCSFFFESKVLQMPFFLGGGGTGGGLGRVLWLPCDGIPQRFLLKAKYISGWTMKILPLFLFSLLLFWMHCFFPLFMVTSNVVFQCCMASESLFMEWKCPKAQHLV